MFAVLRRYSSINGDTYSLCLSSVGRHFGSKLPTPGAVIRKDPLPAYPIVAGIITDREAFMNGYAKAVATLVGGFGGGQMFGPGIYDETPSLTAATARSRTIPASPSRLASRRIRRACRLSAVASSQPLVIATIAA